MVLSSDELIRRMKAGQAVQAIKQNMRRKDLASLPIADLPPYTKWLLKDSEIQQIKKWVFTRQYTQTVVAKMTGLSQSCIAEICTHRTYRHIMYNGYYKMLFGKLY